MSHPAIDRALDPGSQVVIGNGVMQSVRSVPYRLPVIRLLAVGLLLGTAAACAPSWTPESGLPATDYNVPADAQRAFERARFAEKFGDRYGATANYELAAASGHPKVLLFEARYYLRGPEGRDPARAKVALERAVLVESEWQGDAQYLLGKMLVRGDDGVPPEPERGMPLLEAAAAAGAPGSAAELARTLERSGSTDQARIDELWAQAAAAGDEQGIVRHAERLVASGDGGPATAAAVAAAMTALNEHADSGDVNAMRQLAQVYERGTLAPADPEQARRWLARAAEAGDASSATRLARLTRESGGSEDEWLNLLRRAADAGDPRAAGGLARAYLDGDGVERDPEQAEAWAAKAIAGGDTGTMAVFGRAYAEGRGLPRDVPRGLALLEEAAAANEVRAYAYLARLYLRAEDVPPDQAKAIRYAEEAVAAGDVATKGNYGRALLEGKVVPADPQRGIALLKEAAAEGDALASTQLGIAYLEGTGVPVDTGQAVPLLEVGAASGNASAMYRLAQVLLDPGSGQHDGAAGLAMLEQAAAAGHSSAMFTLGRAYLEGNGVAKDPGLARQWLPRAEAAGRGDADGLRGQIPEA